MKNQIKLKNQISPTEKAQPALSSLDRLSTPGSFYFFGIIMVKDPALLFYTSDFLTGTMTMTNDQVGKYIRLLCLQHQKYVLTEKDMLYICGTYDEDIFNKFIKIKGGFYNERLRIESDRRKNFCESRRKSRMSNVRKTHVGHTETETETINENKRGIVKGYKPKPSNIEEVHAYCQERKNTVDPQVFLDFYESKGWKVGNQPMKDWKAAIRTWERRQAIHPEQNKKSTVHRVMGAEATDEYLASMKS